MMDHKNIDRLFQEKLKDFSVAPNDKIWKNIELKLGNKRRKKIIPLWLRVSSAAALVAFLFLNVTSNYKIIITKTPDKFKNNIVEDFAKESNLQTKKNLENPDKNLKNRVELKSSIKHLAKINKPVIRFINNKTLKQDNQKDLLTVTKKINLNKGDNSTDLQTKFNKDDIELIQSESKIASVQKLKAKSLKNKWTIGTMVAPIYLKVNGGSSISAAFNRQIKSNENSVAYGIKVSYRLSKKLALQTGLSQLNLAYNTRGSGNLASSIQSLSRSASIHHTILPSSAKSTSINNKENILLTNGGINLEQSLGYIELPLELKYAVLNNKFGVNLVGGFSTLILNKNEVYYSILGNNTSLGEATNINNLNFSGNFGIDFNYEISKNWLINASPMFKYQFNTFSKNAQGFQPYYIGLYTGLNFRF